MNLSIFPSEDSNLFIEPKNLFKNNEKINVNFIFFKIYENLKYPYVNFLLFKNKNLNIIDFLSTTISDYKDIKLFINDLQSKYSYFTFYKIGIKYFFDVKSNNLYVFCNYLKEDDSNINIDINQNHFFEVNSYDIINIKSNYYLDIDNNVYNFFLKHNSLLYVKNLKSKIKYPCPMSIYKGTKTYYLNHILLFGELPFLFKNNFSYTDYNNSINESLNKYIQNLDFKLIIIQNVTFIDKKVYNKEYLLKNNGIFSNNKKIIEFNDKSLNFNEINVKIIFSDDIFNKVYLKINTNYSHHFDIDHNDFFIYPFFDKIIDNSNRIILKFLSFSDNLIEKKEINNNKIILPHEEYEINNDLNFYFNINNKNDFIIKSSNLNNFYLNDYLYL